MIFSISAKSKIVIITNNDLDNKRYRDQRKYKIFWYYIRNAIVFWIFF